MDQGKPSNQPALVVAVTLGVVARHRDSRRRRQPASFARIAAITAR